VWRSPTTDIGNFRFAELSDGRREGRWLGHPGGKRLQQGSCCAARREESATPTRGMRGLKTVARAARHRIASARWSVVYRGIRGTRAAKIRERIRHILRKRRSLRRLHRVCTTHVSSQGGGAFDEGIRESATRRWSYLPTHERARRPRMANSWPRKSLEPVRRIDAAPL